MKLKNILFKKYFLFLIIIIILLSSISYLLHYSINPYYNNQKRTEIHRYEINYSSLNKYYELMNDISYKLRQFTIQFEPWGKYKCLECRYSYNPYKVNIQQEIIKTYRQLNYTIHEIVGNCTNTLWESFIEYMATGYWLNVKGYLDKAEMYLKGVRINIYGRQEIVRRSPALAYHYLLVARNNLKLLSEFKNSSLKSKMCVIKLDNVRNFVLRLYYKLRDILMKKRIELLNKINVDELRNMKYGVVINVILDRISRELEGNKTIYGNDTFFKYLLYVKYKNLTYYPVKILDEIIVRFTIIYRYLVAIENINIINNLEQYMANYTFVRECSYKVLDAINKLFVNSGNNILKLLITYRIAKNVLLNYRSINDTLHNQYKNNNSLINETSWLIILMNDPNSVLDSIDLIFYKDVIYTLAEVFDEL